MNLDTKGRIIYLDALRGVLILLVVLGHTLQHGDYENRFSWNIIYSFHMAAFFVVSGYVSYKKEVRPKSILKRARQLLIPYFTWSLLSVLFEKGCDFSWMLTYLLQPDTSFWFIWVLFFISAITICILSVSVKNDCQHDRFLLLGGAFLMLLVMLLNTKMFGCHFISYYYIFYVVGMLFGKYRIQIPHFYCFLIGIVWFFLACFWRQHEVPDIVKWIQFLPSSIIIYMYRLICAMLGSIFILEFARRYMGTSTKITNLFAYLGQISLGIYIVHLFFRSIVGQDYLALFSSNTNLQFVIVDFSVKLGVSIIITYLISKNSITSFLLLGK